jgi:hypothetical protein
MQTSLLPFHRARDAAGVDARASNKKCAVRARSGRSKRLVAERSELEQAAALREIAFRFAGQGLTGKWAQRKNALGALVDVESSTHSVIKGLPVLDVLGPRPSLLAYFASRCFVACESCALERDGF